MCVCVCSNPLPTPHSPLPTPLPRPLPRSEPRSCGLEQCFPHVGFSNRIRAEISGTSSQIPFDKFLQVFKKIHVRITKVWLPKCCVVGACAHPGRPPVPLSVGAGARLFLWTHAGAQVFTATLASTEYMELSNAFVVLRVRCWNRVGTCCGICGLPGSVLVSLPPPYPPPPTRGLTIQLPSSSSPPMCLSAPVFVPGLWFLWPQMVTLCLPPAPCPLPPAPCPLPPAPCPNSGSKVCTPSGGTMVRASWSACCS
jgi:hypothetical protein